VNSLPLFRHLRTQLIELLLPVTKNCCTSKYLILAKEPKMRLFFLVLEDTLNGAKLNPCRHGRSIDTAY
jgi:hypothetical protein